MRKKSDFILRFCLIVGDALALILSFAMAYFIRVHVDPRPYAFESQLLEFTWTIVFLVPIMLIILAALGLYKKSIFLGRSRFPERTRLVLAAILSVAALIVYDFFVGENLFPVRVMAVTAMVLCSRETWPPISPRFPQRDKSQVLRRCWERVKPKFKPPPARILEPPLPASGLSREAWSGSWEAVAFPPDSLAGERMDRGSVKGATPRSTCSEADSGSSAASSCSELPPQSAALR